MVSRAAALALALLVATAPTVSAHGAPSPREIDTRVLADATGNGDYGANGNLDEGGLDLLALDVYEGTMPGSTAPALVFRVIVQGGDAGASHTLAFDFQASGAQSYALQTDDLEQYTSTTFSAVRGPFDVGDGHPKAIEGIVPMAELGVARGDQVTGIVVKSSVDGEPADEMPGSWYYSGQKVPLLPTDEEGDPGAYTLDGAAAWFTFDSDGGVITPALEATNITLSLESLLSDLEQFVTLTLQAPAGINATLDSSTALLAPGAAKNVTLRVSGFGAGDVKVLAESDLGLSKVLSFPLAGNATRGNGGEVVTDLLAQGESVQYIFTEPAVFEYHCHPHPWMQATVTIVEDDPTDAPQTHIIRMVEHDHSDPDSFAFSPTELTVQVNDTVVWINEGLQEHNVHGSTGLGGGHGHDHDHDHGDEESKDSPGLPLLALAVMLAVLVARRRG